VHRPALALTAAVTAALAVAACSSSGGGSPSSSAAPSTSAASSSASGNGGGTKPVSGSITVYAAASLNKAFPTLGSQFEKLYPGVKVSFQFGASSDLATQIGQGAPVDVFASASEKNMDQIKDDVTGRSDFVSNTAEIAVPPKNPGKVTTLADLAKSGVKVAVCAEAVPCGALARQVFANAKLTVKPVANLTDVTHTLTTVESGEADAGIVYVTDVLGAGKKVKGITIPDADNASTTYPIATVKDSKNSAVATAFVQYVLSAAGQKVLSADGFSKP
jgi:molybdate transport system substrate-binding protein